MLGPIFNREWLTIPRRANHYVLRSAYLGLLWVLGLTAWQATVGWTQDATLGDNARFSFFLFQVFTLLQLILIPFFSALSAASAITQEKDRRTFVLLLLTDLCSYEIVLGKLLGSLLQIGLLLIGMVPVLALLMLLGGIAPWQVAQASLVIAAAALAAAAVGNLVALWREKTFQVLALTVLFLVLYLCLVRALPGVTDLLQQWIGVGEKSGGRRLLAPENWQPWLDPFRALASVFELADDREAGLSPAYGFAGAMVLFSALLSLWGTWRLRVWNPSGEPIMQREQPEEEGKLSEEARSRAHAAPGPVRDVWSNPILWREVRTRAYGRRPFLVKAAYALVLGLICYYALAPLWTPTGYTPYAAAHGLVPVGILSLLLVSAQAVTAITSERDTGALDLLLVTDLTPKEFIFGKLLGIVYNTKEYLLPPIVLAIVYAALGLLARPSAGHPELLTFKNAEAAVCVVGATLVLLAFGVVLGVHVALNNEKSRLAVIHTLATVFFLSVGTLVCIYLILINGRFEAQWTSFILFLSAGIGGLWWVLSANRESSALVCAAIFCPVGVFYTVTYILVARPGSQESADPLIPFLVIAAAFGFTITAMLVPLLSEFDVALGRTGGGGE